MPFEHWHSRVGPQYARMLLASACDIVAAPAPGSASSAPASCSAPASSSAASPDSDTRLVVAVHDPTRHNSVSQALFIVCFVARHPLMVEDFLRAARAAE